MVDLPDPEQKYGDVLTQAPTPLVTPEEVRRVGMLRANAMTALANGLENVFTPLFSIAGTIAGKVAENNKEATAQADTTAGGAAGAAAGAAVAGPSTIPGGAPAPAGQQPSTSGAQVTTGPSGNSTLIPSLGTLFGVGEGQSSKAYLHAEATRAVTQADLQVSSDFTDMRVKFPGDPEGFKKAATGYINNLKPTGNADADLTIRQNAQATYLSNYKDLVTRKAGADIDGAKATIDAQIGRLTDDTNALLRNGAGVDTPEVASKIAQIHGLYGAYATNPAFAVPKTVIDEELHQKDLQFQGTAMVGQVDRMQNANGSVAATKFVEDWKNNSTLPDVDRMRIAAQGTARIAFNDGQGAVATAGNQAALKGLQERETKNLPNPPGAWESVRDQAVALHDDATANAAAAHIQLAQQHPAALGQTPEQARSADGLAPQRTAQPGVIPGQSDPHKPGFDPTSIGYRGAPATTTPVGAVTPLPVVNNANVSTVRPELLDIVARANTHLPAGYHAEIFSGARPGGPEWSQHHNGNAVDIQIIGPNGRINPEGEDFTGMYGTLAKAALAEQQAHHPELNGKLAWGGNFGTVPGGEVKDLMHFDLGGDRGHFGRLGATGTGALGTPGGDYGARVMGIESSGGRNSTNLYQFQPDTWEKFGAKYGSITDPTAQARAFNDFTASNRADLTAGLGRPPTDAELYLAHQQGSDGALKLLKNPNTPAGQLVPPAHISGNRGDPNAPASSFVNMWAAKFQGGTGMSANGVPFTAEQLRANPYLAAESVRMAAADEAVRTKQFNLLDEAINNSIKNNVAPPSNSLTEYVQLNPGTPESNAKAEKTAAAVTSFEGTKGSIGAVGGGGNIGGLINQANADAVNSPDIWHQQLALARKSSLEAWDKEMKDNPAAFSMKAGYTSRMPAPLDPGNPAGFARTLSEGAQVSIGIAARQGGAAGPAIMPSDLGSAKDIMAYGTPQAKTALLSAVAGLPSPVREQTFAKLGETGAAGAAFAQAGHVASFNPAAANDILNGQSLLAQEPGFAPKSEDMQDRLQKELPTTDLSSPDARGRILEATKAYYAAQKAKQGGKPDGTMDEALWKDSINAVTGGVLEYRGTKVIAPVPGMTQTQFETRIGALQDTDMQGATVGGHPFPASSLKPTGGWSFLQGSGGFRLQTLDPDSGKYLVIAGPSTAPQKVTDVNGRPLVLDLSKGFQPQGPTPPDLYNRTPAQMGMQTYGNPGAAGPPRPAADGSGSGQ